MAWESPSIFTNIESFMLTRYNVRFNEISLLYEYTPIGDSLWKELNVEKLYVEMEKKYLKFSFDKLLIFLSATSPHYNPIVQYFKNLPKWDGTDYISLLSEKVILNSDQQFFKVQFKKFLVRCVLCSIEEKKINKQALVFHSNSQNIGKTTYIRNLVPDALLNYFSENVDTNKDSQIKLATNFMINLDELQAFLTKDIESIKALISRESINERLPYGKRSQRLIRRANFIGSTNRTDILRDSENVRWLIFDISSFDFSYTEIEIDKIWSQAFHLAYSEGFNPFLTKEELNYNEEKNKRFRSYTKDEEELLSFLEESTEESDFLTSSEICFMLRSVAVYKNPINLGKVLNNIGFKTKRVGEERTKKYMVKPTKYYYDYGGK